jgi:hypothetical protein
MVRLRAKAPGIATEVRNHTFRGTGITAYLENGTLKKARQRAPHASTRTSQLYDRREDRSCGPLHAYFARPTSTQERLRRASAQMWAKLGSISRNSSNHLRPKLCPLHGNACHVSARMREASYQSGRNRVSQIQHDDGSSYAWRDQALDTLMPDHPRR